MKQVLHVFCLPYAGGNKYSYRQFKAKAPAFLNFIMLEYPGRGARMSEPLITNTSALVDDLYYQVSHVIDKEDYAIYGHSMGGLLAYLLTVKIAEHERRLPMHLFITGTTAPSAPGRGEKERFRMGQDEFIAELRNFGGMPDEVLENKELLLYLEPILRSDFEASETYLHGNQAALNVPMTVITGMSEELEAADIAMWQRESCYKVDFRRLPGKHFFIFDYVSEIVQMIAKTLTSKTKVQQYE